jgi:hypothetical protein
MHAAQPVAVFLLGTLLAHAAPLLVVTITENSDWIDWFQSPLSCRHIDIAVLMMEMPRGDESRRIDLHDLRLNFLTG